MFSTNHIICQYPTFSDFSNCKDYAIKLINRVNQNTGGFIQLDFLRKDNNGLYAYINSKWIRVLQKPISVNIFWFTTNIEQKLLSLDMHDNVEVNILSRDSSNVHTEGWENPHLRLFSCGPQI